MNCLKVDAVTCLMIFCGLLQAASVNLLENANLSAVSPAGLPMKWQCRTEEPESFFATRNDGFELQRKTHDVVLSQSFGGKRNTTYTLSWESRSPGGSLTYRLYAEWGAMDGQKLVRGGAGSLPRTAVSSWKKESETFTLPDRVMKFSYVALMLKNQGALEIRRLKLEQGSVSGAATSNGGAGELGGAWKLNGKSSFTRLDGKNAVTVSGVRGASAVLSGIPVESGQYYQLDYRVIGRGNAGSVTGFHTFQLATEFGSGKERVLAPWDDVWTQSSQKKNFVFRVPAGIRHINVVCNAGKGEVLFFGFELKKCAPPVEKKRFITLDEPFYRNAIYSSMPVKNIRGRVLFPKGAVRAELAFAGMKRMLDQAGSFTFDATQLSNGKHPLSARFFDGAGKMVAHAEEIIKKLPPSPSEVVMGRDLHFRCNGKLFIPVSDWGLPFQDLDDGLYYAARRGINLVKPYWSNSETIAKLNRAHQLGMKAVLFATHASGSTAGAIREYKHMLHNKFPLEVRNHPAFFGYFLADEPAWVGVPASHIEASYQSLVDFDPYHPVWINEAPRGDSAVHARNGEACDIYGIDIYPVPWPSVHSGLEDKTMSSVGKYSAFCREVTGNRKAIWMALQGFSWHALDRKRDDGTGYPSLRDLEFMVFDALTAGAGSVGFWGTTYVKTPWFYDAMMNAADQLYRLSGVFAAPMSQRKTDNPNVRVSEYAVGKQRYFIAVNTVEKSSQALFAESLSQPIVTLDEKAPIQTKDGKVQLNMAPYEVRIFGSAPLPPPISAKPAKHPPFDRITEHPLRRYLRALEKQSFYRGNAQWIWANGVTGDHTKVTLARAFEVTKKVRKASVLFTADDFSDLYLNGRRLASSETWSRMVHVNFTPVQGTNLLLWQVRNETAAFGAIAEIEIEYADGAIEKIATNSQWRAVNSFQAPSVSGAIAAKWPHAVVIAAASEGAWQGRVAVPESK